MSDLQDCAQNSMLLPEWTEQDAVLLAWPHAQSDWSSLLPRIEDTYLAFMAAITRYESVILLVNSEPLLEYVQARIKQSPIQTDRVTPCVIPYDDTWLRDSGPLTVQGAQGLQLLDFRFNGWGGKYLALDDDQICQRLNTDTTLLIDSFIAQDIFLEGGSIDTNGAGSLLTTRQCLLAPTRNPQLQEADYAELFLRLFGTRQVLWIENSELAGDDTDGHIDMLARFCNASTIAYTSCDYQHDPQFESLGNMAEELRSFRDLQGAPFELVPLPIPAAIHNREGHRLPASYANFLIINQAVLVPTYADQNDHVALSALAGCFPDRKVIGIDARAAIEQYGSLHCLSMQLPRGVLRREVI